MLEFRGRKTITGALLALVFVSVGFSLGKNAALRSFAKSSPALAPTSGVLAAEKNEFVAVYYMHATFRCVTCNEIERLARKLVETEFKEELESGKLVFAEVNFQRDTGLAKRYRVAAGGVVVALIKDGKDVRFDMLNDVWTLYSDPAKFDEYLAGTIRRYLAKDMESP
ncbi:MAG: hypothetical protein JW808_11415 [Victivallales bacterium]|nr:hypothetical protein [Victivallales bacterium]